VTFRVAAARPRSAVAAFAVVLAAVIVSGCGGEASRKESLSVDLARCGQRGAPITLAHLVDVLRSNGITLTINESNCDKTEKERSDAALNDATNFGPSGLDSSAADRRAEGSVICAVNLTGNLPDVSVNKFSTDQETSVTVRNVSCTLFPSDEAREVAQVERLRKAFVVLADELP
jgi:hypothetical protein